MSSEHDSDERRAASKRARFKMAVDKMTECDDWVIIVVKSYDHGEDGVVSRACAMLQSDETVTPFLLDYAERNRRQYMNEFGADDEDDEDE